MAGNTNFSDLTFIGQDSFFARKFARPFARFLAVEAAGGILLLIATAAALIWVNSPWGDSYDAFWGSSVDLSVNGIEIFAGHSLSDFVNDALMAVFFFVVGLEIKRELVDGQLRNPRDAALPAFAAIGGMVIPAALYLLLNAGGPGQDGWGIPMATDIAFAVGIVSLLGDRVPRKLKVFLLSLAIVDDIGAIIVIALFYSSGISTGWLIASGLMIVVILMMRQLRVWYIPLYIFLGAIFWWTTFRSGVHATIAGVILGLITPAKPLQSEDDTRTIARWLRDKPEVFPVDVRYAGFRIRESVSVAERLESSIHPLSSFAIIPIFALANAGVRINGDILSAAFESPVMWGIILGLVVGKTVGITALSWLAARLGIATMPREMTMRHLVGLAMIAGIGFTVSLFVSNLAFAGADDHHSDETAYVIEAETHGSDTVGDSVGDRVGAGAVSDEPVVLAFAEDTGPSSPIEDNAKIGILLASIMASIGGLLILSGAGADDDEEDD